MFLRTVVTFESDAFNNREQRDYFVNPGCYGDDAANWLIQRLRQAGIKTNGNPGQEDFGWYFDFDAPAGPHCVVIAYRPDEPNGCWIA